MWRIQNLVGFGVGAIVRTPLAVTIVILVWAPQSY